MQNFTTALQFGPKGPDDLDDNDLKQKWEVYTKEHNFGSKQVIYENFLRSLALEEGMRWLMKSKSPGVLGGSHIRLGENFNETNIKKVFENLVEKNSLESLKRFLFFINENGPQGGDASFNFNDVKKWLEQVMLANAVQKKQTVNLEDLLPWQKKMLLRQYYEDAEWQKFLDKCLEIPAFPPNVKLTLNDAPNDNFNRAFHGDLSAQDIDRLPLQEMYQGGYSPSDVILMGAEVYPGSDKKRTEVLNALDQKRTAAIFGEDVTNMWGKVIEIGEKNSEPFGRDAWYQPHLVLLNGNAIDIAKRQGKGKVPPKIKIRTELPQGLAAADRTISTVMRVIDSMRRRLSLLETKLAKLKEESTEKEKIAEKIEDLKRKIEIKKVKARLEIAKVLPMVRNELGAIGKKGVITNNIGDIILNLQAKMQKTEFKPTRGRTSFINKMSSGFFNYSEFTNVQGFSGKCIPRDMKTLYNLINEANDTRNPKRKLALLEKILSQLQKLETETRERFEGCPKKESEETEIKPFDPQVALESKLKVIKEMWKIITDGTEKMFSEDQEIKYNYEKSLVGV